MFLGKIAANQNLSGIVIKLTRERGELAVSGTVTRNDRPVETGRVGAWQKRKEIKQVFVGVHRGRTVPAIEDEFAWSPLGPGGDYTLEGLQPGDWYLLVEAPGAAPTVVGPLTLKETAQARMVDIDTVAGGAIEGWVENVPEAMEGQVWVVAFDDTIIRREARVAPDGTFRLDDLPPGRYGLKVGHDAYIDPHLSRGDLTPQEFRKLPAEPWQGAVVVHVASGATARGVVLDFRPPGPLVKKESESP